MKLSNNWRSQPCKPRTCRSDCLQMHPNQVYVSVRVAAFLPGADGKCAEGGRGSSERCQGIVALSELLSSLYRIWGNSSLVNTSGTVSLGPVPKIQFNLGILKHILARYISQRPNSHQMPIDSVHSGVESL